MSSPLTSILTAITSRAAPMLVIVVFFLTGLVVLFADQNFPGLSEVRKDYLPWVALVTPLSGFILLAALTRATWLKRGPATRALSLQADQAGNQRRCLERHTTFSRSTSNYVTG
jgi:hypothetical protein